jgi:hypothetical protein
MLGIDYQVIFQKNQKLNALKYHASAGLEPTPSLPAGISYEYISDSADLKPRLVTSCTAKQ